MTMFIQGLGFYNGFRCFTMGKASWSGTFPKCKARPNYHLVLNLLFWECPHLIRPLPYTKFKMSFIAYMIPNL